VCIGLIGALIILRPGAEMFQPASLLLLATAACLATYQIVTRMMGGADSIWTTMLYTTLFGSVASSLMMPGIWMTPPVELIPLLAIIGLIGFGGHLCLVWALGQAPASLLAPFNYTQMVWSVLIGFLIFAEVPDLTTIAGATVIVGAGLYVWHRERVRKGAVPQPSER
jgi:drug/metabolite transporter (DMT)-like permease